MAKDLRPGFLCADEVTRLLRQAYTTSEAPLTGDDAQRVLDWASDAKLQAEILDQVLSGLLEIELQDVAAPFTFRDAATAPRPAVDPSDDARDLPF